MANKKFYVTTPIFYPTAEPHIGTAYTVIAADILARWNSIQNKDVFFLTGTDENAKKVFQAAQERRIPIKEFVDKLSQDFKEAWKKLNISYNRFIRTTDKDHEKTVQNLLNITYKKGDIYLGKYEGYYCIACEAYYTEKDLINGCCPTHQTKAELIKEESYFFKLSKYQKKLLDLYKKNPEFIQPASKKQEIINRVKKELRDLSISRKDYGWGIKLPFDKTHCVYVWYDALTNYYTATREKGKEKYWPADVHLVGKDILWFHSVIWPAILFSVGIKLPKTVYAHGWWTFNNEKISKSRGKVINVDELISIAGVDSARYFLFRETPFGEDGDFSTEALINRHNNELANKLGNLISRVSTLAETHGLKKTQNKLIKKLKIKEIQNYIDNYQFDKALSEIFAFIDKCNLFIQDKKPWENATKNKSEILYELADSIKAIAILLYPFTPQTSEKIAKQFHFNITFKEISKPLTISKIKKSEILFRKIDIKNKTEEKNKKDNINKSSLSSRIEGIAAMNTINYNEWEKLDLRVGQIIKVEDIEGADKLYKLEIDLGKQLGKRTVCAGIKQHYKKDQLKNKKVIIFANLAPRMIKGIESKGMLLAAVNENESKIILISPEKDIELGSKIR
ncbi:methionine--tRNA ligase [Candidatus Pacearchaeota archaeon]|nr:methionine--tRNA ligase [Candidatus Pacearchaeota archaeon]